MKSFLYTRLNTFNIENIFKTKFDWSINLPVQIHGKLITTIKTEKGYEEEDILKSIYEIEKVKNKILGRKVIKIINVQDKIINIITD